jgi:hypothetical protein
VRPFGYVCTDGAFPAKPSEVAGWTNLYVAWAFYEYWKGEQLPDGKIDHEAWLTRMKTCVNRVGNTTTMRFYLGLWGQNPDMLTNKMMTRVFEIMRPWWSRVSAIDIADEPKWTKQETKANLRKVRDLLQTLKLPYKPIGITYTSVQSTGGDESFGIVHIKDGKLVGPDFVTLELYTLPQDQGTTANISFISKNIKKAWSLLDPSTRCWYWLQGFNRNGVFTSEQHLAELQWPSYKLVKDDPRTEGLLIFNWARSQPSINSKGTKLMPSVAVQHRRIAHDLGVITV